ncbi:translation initiation factor 3 subunit I [Entomortierella parvispora]|uniref:Eukaryotic translation initiation factor 3 subunit I n=1 Tax=Entomortierella parvispora TaxID=205924 RepID=A0A9P3H573_9FUNG|nr:translation initiation factor 3 subunit I [Entomortierella parvispora]
MRPILLQGHERSLTQIKYNREGDLLFSVSKDHVVNAWFSHNGERLGTYEGHIGAVWTVDVNSTSTLLVSGSADNTAKIWDVSNGKCLKSWEFNTAVRRVQFSEDDKMVLIVTEPRMGFPATLQIFNVENGLTEPISSEPLYNFLPEGPKITVAAWSALNRYIIAGRENGSVVLIDAESGSIYSTNKIHELTITDLQMSADRTYFITSSKDKSAKVVETESLEVLKTYSTDTPLNSAAIMPKVQEFVVVGGGQEAMDVTRTSSRQGKFECRFWHKILEEEVGRVRGHFGPINTIAIHPDGRSFASGGEDGYVRVHHFDDDFFTFKFQI